MYFTIQSPLLIGVITRPACAYTEPATDLARAAHRGDLRAVRHMLTPELSLHAATLALDWAARGGHPAGPHECRGESELHRHIVEALIDAGANVNGKDERPHGRLGPSGWTALHTAIHHRPWAIARVLIEHGADPYQPSHQGVTPAQMAAWGEVDIARLRRGGQ
jgi:ankyrin repeat protein